MQSDITPNMAEFMGVLVADGNIQYNKSYRGYRVKIAGDKRYETEYFTKHLANIIRSEFGLETKFYEYKKNNGFECYFYSKKVVEELLSRGMVTNKNKTSPRIPKQIKEDKILMKAFLRGFFDCDGTVYRKYGNYLQIGFRNIDTKILKLIHGFLEKLDYHPSITLKHNNVFIHRQAEVTHFFDDIKPANQKHCKRLEKLKDYS